MDGSSGGSYFRDVGRKVLGRCCREFIRKLGLVLDSKERDYKVFFKILGRMGVFLGIFFCVVFVRFC